MKSDGLPNIPRALPGFPVPPILVAAEGAAFGAACMMHQRFLSPEDRGGMG